MSILSTIYISVMSVCLALAIVNFIIWLNQRTSLEYLLFALTALSAGTIAIMDGIAIRITDPERYLVITKFYHIPIYCLLISMIWFIKVYFKTGRKWLALLITGIWSVCMIINFSTSHGLTYVSIESIQNYSFYGKDFFNMPKGTGNPLRFIADLASVFILIFLLDATSTLYKQGNKERSLVVGGSTLLFMLLAGAITPLVDVQKVKLPSMISIPFMFIIIAMSFELIRDILQVQILSNILKTRKRNWDNLVENVELLVVKVDRMGKVEMVNPYFLKKTGFDESEVIQKDWLTNFIPESDRRKILKRFELPIKDTFPTNYQNNILAKNGEELKVHWSNVALVDEQGNFSGLAAVGNDVTDREKAYQEVLQLKQQLEAENLVLKESFAETAQMENIVCKSPAAKYALEKANQVAAVDSIVLLEGETGVGKGLFARYIHNNSSRCKAQFIHVNCAAIPSELLESELFGHEKGAFTGAQKQKKGRFDLADGGTIFLDEIGELPASLQPKLLHVLQSGEFEPLGSEKTKKVDVRIIAATNKRLSEEVAKGNFREDLFYRLNVFPITIPSLRKRKEDIPELINLFVGQYNKKYNKKITKVSKHTYLSFSTYEWPGNIRELQNVVERAVISCKKDVLKTNGILTGEITTRTVSKDEKYPKETSLEAVERNHILKILEQCNWRVHGPGGAAQLLDINPSTLRSRMKKLEIERETANSKT